MEKVNLRRLLTIAGLASQAIIYVVLWTSAMLDPRERTGADFLPFYAAGRIALQESFANVYLPEEQQQAEAEVLGFSFPPEDLNPFVHPPFILPVLALVAGLPYVPAFHAWALLNLVFFGAGLWLLSNTITQGIKRSLFITGGLLFYPLFVSLLNGQDSGLLLLGGALLLRGLNRGEDILAGVGLGLMTIRPHIALFLALPFLFQRRKVWWGFMVMAGALVLASLLLVGRQGALNFLDMLQLSAGGENYRINEEAMVNLIGWLNRLMPGISGETIRLAGWVGYGLGIALLCLVWGVHRKISEKHLSLAVLLALFLSPHLHFHDLALLLLHLACLVTSLVRRGWLKPRDASLLPLWTSLFLLLGSLIPGVKFDLPLLVMLVTGTLLWIPVRVRESGTGKGMEA